MNLKEYVEGYHIKNDISLPQTHEQFGTQKRFTRIMNRPERATLVDVMRLAKRLNAHPLFLLKRFGMGKTMINQDDREQLAIHYVVDPTPPNTQPQTSEKQPIQMEHDASA